VDPPLVGEVRKVSARKIGLLLLVLGFGAVVETAWQVRGDVRIGPEGCRVLGGRFYGPSWSFERTAERAIADAAPRLEVRNAFGDVRVSAGAPGVVKVRLRTVVFLPTEEKARAFSDRVELRLSGEGSSVRVGTNREEVGRGEDVGFETHLEIEAPGDATVDVRNEHGRVDLAGLAAADLVSSFGGVSVERIAGRLKLESRHGEVRASGIGGDAEVRSRHGAVDVSDLAGAAKLDVEQGEVVARRTGALEVSVEHGGLSAETVGGDLAVRGGHSGVRASDVVGRAEVETSFGGVHLARVGGEVRAKAQHGEVEAEDVSGPLVAETSHGRIRLARVDGAVEASADSGEVEASGLAAGAKLRARGGDVSVDGFAGRLDVEVERGSARLTPRAPLSAELTVSVAHGEASLGAPEGSHFDLEAQSRRGEARADVAGLALSETGGEPGRGHRILGRLGGGGPTVRLRADGDVVVEAAPALPIADGPAAKPARAEARPAEAAPTPSPTPARPAEEPATR
jgi:DUF4097 and DUF4098 domain-containing protein YvlB